MNVNFINLLQTLLELYLSLNIITRILEKYVYNEKVNTYESVTLPFILNYPCVIINKH